MWVFPNSPLGYLRPHYAWDGVEDSQVSCLGRFASKKLASTTTELLVLRSTMVLKNLWWTDVVVLSHSIDESINVLLMYVCWYVSLGCSPNGGTTSVEEQSTKRRVEESP